MTPYVVIALPTVVALAVIGALVKVLRDRRRR